MTFFGLLLTLSLAPLALQGAGFVGRPRSRPRRESTYKVAAGALLIIGTIALALDLAGARRGVLLLLTVPSLDVFLAWTALATGFCLAIWAAARPFARTPPRAELLPRNAGERTFLLVGAVIEEYVFRGYFLTVMLLVMIHSPFIPLALVTLCSALFHGPRIEPVVRYMAIGVVLMLPVLATGSLLPSIVARLVLETVSMARSARSSSPVAPAG